MQVEVFPAADDAANATASLIAAQVERAAAAAFSFGLAGGSTPRAAYRSLRDLDVPWKQVVCWLTDERWVPHDHQESNGKMASDELVDHVEGRLLLPDTSLPKPRLAAAAYEDLIFPLLVQDGTLAPDLVLLGIGDDGHTASLFPGTEAVEAKIPAYVATWVPGREVWRLTATIGLLSAARNVVFLVTGRQKADVIHRILDGEEPLPARLVADAASNSGSDVTWLLDAEAAARL